MGFPRNIVQRLRHALRGDKGKQASTQLARGTRLAVPDSYNMLSTFGYDALSDWLKVEYDLMARYVDYEEMDEYPEVASSLDIYADDATQPDTVKGKSLWVDSKDVVIKQRLTELFDHQLRLDEDLWEIARTLVKYGNDFEELIITPEQGVVGMNFLPPPTIRRVEGVKGELLGFLQDLRAQFTMTPDDFKQMLVDRDNVAPGTEHENLASVPFDDFEVVHFRMRGKYRRSIYGFGALESARWIWKRLQLMEDAALIYRLSRAPSRYAFYVDVGTLPPKEAMGHVNRFKNQLKKQKFVDPVSGKLNLKWNPLAYDEDFFIPVRDGKKSAEIDTVTGPSWQHMEDIEYFLRKLYSALKVPKSYLNYGDDESGKQKGTLSQEDVRFARTVIRIQRELRNGVKKIGRVHLAALGIDAPDNAYDIGMTVPSAIFELAQVEVKNAKLEFAEKIGAYVSQYWIMSKVLGFSDEEIADISRQRAREGQAGVGPGAQGGGMSEAKLFAGNPKHERLVEDNFHGLLLQNKQLGRRLLELQALTEEIRSSVIR